MIIGSKNKGDWSEFYTLLYLLGTGRLDAADENLRRMANYYFPIIRIMRDEKDENRIKKIDYVLPGGEDGQKVEIYIDSKLMRTMSAADFREEAKKLYDAISDVSRENDNIPHAEQFLNDIGLTHLSAPSTDITDISMMVHDTCTGTDQRMGFSIKSYIGNAPTLLNASGATNFIYDVTGLNAAQIEKINAINTRDKIIDRIREINNQGGSLTFRHTENNVFQGNLMMIDTMMDVILATILQYHYESNETSCSKCIDYIEELNPFNYPRKGMYQYKFKKFLAAKALGMDPSKPWNGINDANGGYIVVKSDGEVVAYHLYNRDQFEQYLYENTRFERASTSRHHYATIETIGNKSYMALNMQIRFMSGH